VCNIISCIDEPDIKLSLAVVDLINKLVARTDEELELLATVLYIDQRLKDAAENLRDLHRKVTECKLHAL